MTCFPNNSSFYIPFLLLQQKKVPVLNLFGTADRYIDVGTSQMSAEFVEDYSERLFDGVSHWVMIEEPEKFNAAMEEYLKSRGL